MGQTQKLRDVTLLAKHKVGSTVYIVDMVADGQKCVKVKSSDKWMLRHHPKVLHERKLDKSWKTSARLPKLPALFFSEIVTIVTSRFFVAEFKICEISRSADTGEFYYRNKDNEWMPESYVFATHTAAHRERFRIYELIKRWAERAP